MLTMTVPEAARRAGKNPETIRRWIREGKLRAHKVGTQHVIEADDLTAMVEAPRSHRAGEAQAAYGVAGEPALEVERIPNEWLPAIVGRIVRSVDPLRIILIGDRARSRTPHDSDYELVVVLDDVPDRLAARVVIRRSFEDIPAPAEIAVVSSSGSTERPQETVAWALQDGRTVYERDRAS